MRGISDPSTETPGPSETSSRLPTAAKEELARDLGYSTAREMMEQTEVVPLAAGGYAFLTTDSDNYWVAWEDKLFYNLQRFDSRQAALTTLRDAPVPVLNES